MARQARKNRPTANKSFKRKHDIKRRKKDEDQIYEEYINPLEQKVDIDLPGLGQFYCASCSKHHKDQEALESHFKTALHKKLLRKIRNEKPYSLEEAMAAAGVSGSYRYDKKGLLPGELSLGQKEELAKKQLEQEQEANMEDVQTKE